MIPGVKQAPIKFGEIMVYVALAIKHLRLMVLLLCLSMMVGLVAFVYTRPVYYSRTLIEVKDRPLPVTAENVYQDSNFRAVVSNLTSPHITERTARRFGIDMEDKYFRRKYLKKMVIRPNSQGNLEVEVWSWSRDIAEHWTERVLEEYLAYREEQRQRRRDLVMNDFTKEMKRVNEKMEEWLNTNFSYQDTNKITELTVQLRELQALPVELARVNYQLDELQSLRKKLDSKQYDMVERLSIISSYQKMLDVKIGDAVPLLMQGPGADGERQNAFLGLNVTNNNSMADSRGREIVVVPSMTDSGTVQPWDQSEKDLRTLQAEAAELSTKYLPAHPKMKAVNDKIALVKKDLQLNLDTMMNRVDLRIKELGNRKQELIAKLPEYLDAQKQEAKLKLAFEHMSAGQLGWRQFYDGMAKSISLLEFGDDRERMFYNYLGPIELRLNPPVSPNRMNLAVMAFGFGIFLAFGVPFLIEYLDHTIGTIEVGEDVLKLRALGVVPQLESDKELDKENEGSTSLATMTENFRVIRTNLAFDPTGDKDKQVVMVASAMPQEGKTYVARNIAASFAKKGERTILIDADIRRGTVHNAFKMSSVPGLAEVLMGTMSFKAVIKQTDISNLDVLVRGKFDETVADQFGDKAFSEMIADLRGQYDRIVLDTPPVLGLAETSALLPSVDGVLFVIWSGRTPLRNVKIAIDTLRANGAHFFGFVLNRLDLTATSNYYYYYYYSHNYYESYQPVDKA